VKIFDYTPDYYVEKKWLANILSHVSGDLSVVIRDQADQPTPESKYISIITSTEKHNYIPIDDLYNDNCLGVFMNYAPIRGDSYQIDNFYKHSKLHHLPLGYHKDFPVKKPWLTPPVHEREFDVCFWGQYDPYRRLDFVRACESIAAKYKTSFKFYTGWNNGASAQEYAHILENSVIALVPWGSASRNSFRFWESYYSDCIILCNEQYNTWYNKMNYFTCKDDWSDIEEQIDLILRNKMMISISNSVENLLDEKEVAQYIMGVICQ